MTADTGVTLEDLPTKCPAFASECPYKDIASESKLISSALQNCPAFDRKSTASRPGMICPFVDCKSVDDVLDVFGKLPASHVAVPSLPELLRMMHEKTAALKLEMGACPVFSPTADGGGCPFKTLTAGGQPLVAELERASWAQALLVDAPTESAPALPLSKQLKEGTKETHKAAESVHFVKEFLKGKVPRDVYKAMIKDLYHVYSAMEAAAHHCREHPSFKPVHFPEQLNREDALAADCAYYYGPSWRELPECRPSPAAAAYVARLHELAETAPELLLAHTYTRYMGDLSGGRVLMRVAIKTLGLDATVGDGIRFYQFDKVESAKSFKIGFRSALDALAPPPALAARLTAEANAAFRLNMDLFRELDQLLGFQDAPLDTATAPAKDCPFGFTTASGGSDASVATSASRTPPRETLTEIAVSNCPVHLAFYTGRMQLLRRSQWFAPLLLLIISVAFASLSFTMVRHQGLAQPGLAASPALVASPALSPQEWAAAVGRFLRAQ